MAIKKDPTTPRHYSRTRSASLDGSGQEMRIKPAGTLPGVFIRCCNCEGSFMRTIVCAALALVLFVGVAEAAKAKKKAKTVSGEIVSVDTEKGTLKVLVKSKKDKEGKEVEFTDITDKTSVISYSGGEKTELTGADVLKKDQFKKGAKVTITTDADGKVTQITFGKAKKKKKTNTAS
jgi:hypothetical protein